MARFCSICNCIIFYSKNTSAEMLKQEKVVVFSQCCIFSHSRSIPKSLRSLLKACKSFDAREDKWILGNNPASWNIITQTKSWLKYIAGRFSQEQTKPIFYLLFFRTSNRESKFLPFRTGSNVGRQKIALIPRFRSYNDATNQGKQFFNERNKTPQIQTFCKKR